MNYFIAASTDAGARKTANQDSLNVSLLTAGSQKMAFAVLCDGMGGLQKGEVASASVVRAYSRWARERLPALISPGITDAVIRSDWLGLAAECNEKIKVYGRMNSVTLGTTVTVLLLTAERYFILHVGDTRAYEIAEAAVVLTRDQTLAARAAELGLLTEQAARTDMRRNVLLQCIGASEEVHPDFFSGTTRKDAVYLLCSDGFRHEISAEEIFSYLKPGCLTGAGQMKSRTEALIRLNRQRQEKDNISVITIRTF